MSSVSDHRKRFAELLNDEEGVYSAKLRQNVQDENFRFVLNINEVRAQDTDLATRIVKRPPRVLDGPARGRQGGGGASGPGV